MPAMTFAVFSIGTMLVENGVADDVSVIFLFLAFGRRYVPVLG